LVHESTKRVSELLKNQQVPVASLQEQSFESSLIKYEEDQAIRQQLQMAFKSLPARQQEVIELLFYKEFSYEEISAILSINLRSVYTLAWKAISSLKKRLDR
jgi:RNA polymerase sigma factor (sigma-70 family)